VSETGRRDDLLLVVAFSGGGTRAAAFAYGVLEELRDTQVSIGGQPRRLLDEVDFVSGVSGGSFTAAYYGLHGDGIFRDFEQRLLRRNVQRDLLLSLLNPINWFRLLSPLFSRSDLAAEYYDQKIFDGRTFADLAQGPRVELVINATDMVRGNRFSFRQLELDFLCADLAPIPLARAVAASAAVPGPLTPVILNSYAGTCGFEPPAWIAETLVTREESRRRLRQAAVMQSYLDPGQRYVYLLDGGISDNLGVRFSFERIVEQGGFYEVLARAGIVDARQIVMIVVNAETEPELAVGRGGLISLGLTRLIRTVTGIQTRSSNFETIELVRSSFEGWARELAGRRGHPVEFRLVDLYFDALPDPAERAYLRNLPTSFVLDDEAVDRLRAAGRALLRSSPQLHEALVGIEELPGP
jgi:NTE family protein